MELPRAVGLGTACGWAPLLLTLALTGAPPVASAAESPTQEEAAAIAEEAFVYGFPIVLDYQFLHATFVAAGTPAYKGPFNQVHPDARVYTPDDTAVQTPNSDTPYATLGADLRAEPLVICTPEIEEGRYFSVQLVDMYTFNYGYAGTRTTGNGAACHLVAGPGWQGEKPKGIDRVFRSESPFGLIVFRTQLFGPDDLANVKRIQAALSARPLSDFLGQPAPAAAPAMDWPKPGGDGFGKGFPELLDFLLRMLPAEGPAAGEKPLRERIARIGIGPGRTQPFAGLPKTVQEAVLRGFAAASKEIDARVAGLGSDVNGWRIGVAAGPRSFFDGDWLLRAAGARAGIYGNDAAEATYPFTRHDSEGHPLDGSRYRYVLRFEPDALPPVEAFWSITMYYSGSQFLVPNPIHRYHVDSGMLADLERDPDGSIPIYIQHESPGAGKEPNWLPAPEGPIFLVMRLYVPREAPPSVLPPGQGSWKPPPVEATGRVPVAKEQRRGDKSHESVIRTDELYGDDPFFQGPRGWPYWNELDHPRPIQEPNLWPDMQSTYFLGQLDVPAGGVLTLRGAYPHARYLEVAAYRWEKNTYVSAGALSGEEIEPDPGSTNPFRPGADRLAGKRDFTVRVAASDAPTGGDAREANTVHVGAGGGKVQLVIRIYLPDPGFDGAGWGPATAPDTAGASLPRYEATLADGTRLDAGQVAERLVHRIPGNTKTPLGIDQWIALVHAKDNDPALTPATAPARQPNRWHKYWRFPYSIVGAFKTPAEQAKIPWQGAMDGGGDPYTEYLYTFLSREFGPVYVMRGRMPTFPDTWGGDDGAALAVMPEAQVQYWSVVSGEAVPSGAIVDGINDMQVPLDAERNYTIVVSRREDRPRNATAENGVAWLEWSPRGEGLQDPRNRTAFGILMMRVMAADPGWKQGPGAVTRPGTEEDVMGPYLPRGEYTDKARFEAEGPGGTH